jgi:hypothetical protein
MANVSFVNIHNYYFVKPEDDIILVDPSGLNSFVKITLPLSGIENGKTFKIKNIRNTINGSEIVMSSDSVYFDYNFPSITLPGASSCEVVYYNGCYHVLSIQSL